MTDNPKLTVNQVLDYGMRLAQEDPAAARKFFEKALERDPKNVTALLWLAGLGETAEESLRYAARVLEIDPKNERAKAAIRWARKRARSGPSTDRAVSRPDRIQLRPAARLRRLTRSPRRGLIAAHRSCWA